MRLQAIILLAAGLLAAAAPPEEAAKVGDKSWAAISVNRPVFSEGTETQILISVALVNDGDKVVDPRVDSSRLLVNGKELKDWPIVIGNGPRDERWQALPPGDYLSSACDVTEYFRKPGTYRVSWRGQGFQSPEIVFRVMPKHGK